MTAKRKGEPKGISRFDYPHSGRGYLVRVVWHGERMTAAFFDSSCGDRVTALRRAIAFRNKAERTLHKPRTETWIRSRGTVASHKIEWMRGGDGNFVFASAKLRRGGKGR